jgi:hypothetical protein
MISLKDVDLEYISGGTRDIFALRFCNITGGIESWIYLDKGSSIKSNISLASSEVNCACSISCDSGSFVLSPGFWNICFGKIQIDPYSTCKVGQWCSGDVTTL